MLILLSIYQAPPRGKTAARRHNFPLNPAAPQSLIGIPLWS
jgi:hypothetical protein